MGVASVVGIGGASGGHGRGSRRTLDLEKRKLAEAESAAWERPKSPSPPPPPPCSTQARGRGLQPIATYKSATPRDDRNPDSIGHDGATTTARPRRPTAPTQPRCNSTRKRRRRDHNSVFHDATTTPYSAQEPPQRYPHTARNPHRYDTNDDGDAAAGTARSWAGRAGRTMQQELSSSGGPRGCRRQWLHGQWWQQQRDYRSDGGSMYGQLYEVSHHAEACATVSDHLRPTDCISLPDLAALARGTSPSTLTRSLPPQTYIRQLAPRGGLRDRLRTARTTRHNVITTRRASTTSNPHNATMACNSTRRANSATMQAANDHKGGHWQPQQYGDDNNTAMA
ncbi:hypothetical protein EDB83DRAFT_2615078 [Lactarius deliciosus]|nr:hypothetical protein EDB83DRAFT_2615078 [Lactarius deliciosus]